VAEVSRIVLALIRLVNGVAALAVPGLLARQIGVDPDANPGILYVFRMFGIRTVLIGVELLTSKGHRRTEALRKAVLIHASDTLAAAVAVRSSAFPNRGRVIVLISALNTLLAVAANRRTNRDAGRIR
jgi:hypothetical protein